MPCLVVDSSALDVESDRVGLMFTIPNVMDQLFTWFYYGALEALTDFQKYMGDMGAEVFDNDYAKGLIQFFFLLAWGLWIIGSVIALAENGVDTQSGGGNLKNTGMNILKGFVALNLFTVIPVKLFTFSVEMQNIITQIYNKYGLKIDLSNEQQPAKQATNTSFWGGLYKESVDFFSNLIADNPIAQFAGSAVSWVTGQVTGSNSNSAPQEHVPTFATLLFLVIFVICFLKVVFDNLKRGAILLVQICVCSLYMFSVPRGYTDGFVGWCKQIVGICFTTFLQNIFLIISLSALKSNLVFGLGIMLAAAEIPRIAQSFGLETGFKANFTSIAMTTNSFVNLGKSLLKAGK